MTAAPPRCEPEGERGTIMQDGHLATCNAEVATNAIRRETLAGRDHLVAPVVAVQEMVLKGEFLSAEEIAESEPAWNGRVLPIGHPTDDAGEFVSANSPEVHDRQSVGRFFDADGSDGSLAGEVWVDIEKSKRLAEQSGEDRFVKPLAILASHAEGEAAQAADGLDVAVNDGDLLEVSTAYFYHRQDAMGTHDGEKYSATQHNVRPDHLALLPNSTGECSVEDGCGAPRAHVHANVDTTDGQAGSGAQPGDGTPNGEQQTVLNYATMSDHIEWLASHSSFDAEVLEGFDADHLQAMRESLEEAGHDGECQCGGGADAGGQEEQEQTNGGDADGTEGGESDVPPEVQARLDALSEEVSSLKAERESERKERATHHAERIAEHSESFEDADAVFETLGTEPDALESLADEFERQAAAGGQADFGGRVGANSGPGGSDDESEDYLALAQQGNSTRFGDPEESD